MNLIYLFLIILLLGIDMFYLYEFAIDTVLKQYENYVTEENKFIRKHKFDFKDITMFFLFNKGSSNQDDLDDFVEDKFNNLDFELTRQNLSQQRNYIDPLVFKEISKEYLKKINYKVNNPLLETFKVFSYLLVMGLILKYRILKM